MGQDKLTEKQTGVCDGSRQVDRETDRCVMGQDKLTEKQTGV